MKETVIIKVYRADITGNDYHDLLLDESGKKLEELKSFAKSIDKNVYFTVCSALDCAEFDCFAEITYNGTLSEQEKDAYLSIIKYFMKDAKIVKDTLDIYDLPLSVIFTKAQIETL